MSEIIYVFGFGSLFSGTSAPNDVDLLIVHESTSRQSCELAIGCKRLILEALPTADVVLLSKQEEYGNRFIARSAAVALDEIRADHVDEDTRRLINSIVAMTSPPGNPAGSVRR